MAAVFYNQNTLFYNRGQTSSLSFAFIALERSEWASTKRHWDQSPQDIIPAAWYLRNCLLFWCYLELFIVCLPAVTTQITANKKTGLLFIPLKERVERFISGPLESQRLRFKVLFPWQNQNNVKCIGQKNPKNRHHCRQKTRKSKTKLVKTRKPRKALKPKNCSFKERKPKNRNENRPNPQNRKSQRSPP